VRSRLSGGLSKNKFFYPDSFDSLKDLIYNLRNFLFEYHHLRGDGGLEYIIPHEKLRKLPNY